MVIARATVFEQKRIGSHADAPSHLENFEVSGDNLMLPIAFLPDRECCGCGFCCCCCWWLTIPENFKAIVCVHGRAMGVWSAGCHFAPPWVTLSFLIPERPFTYYTPVSCKTADNINVTIVPTMEVRIDTSPGDSYEFEGIFAFTHQLGASALSQMLNALLDETFRGIVKTQDYHETCEFMDGKLETKVEETMTALTNNFQKYGIMISRLSIKKLTFDDPYSAKGRAQLDANKARNDGNSELRSKYQRVLKLIEENERDVGTVE